MNTMFIEQIKRVIPEPRVLSKLIERQAYGTDASFYYLLPKLVLKIANIEEMQHLLRLSQQFNVPLTFRAAGTSLSGQAITDSVLVLLTDDWNRCEVRENGEEIFLLPGVIGAHANKVLVPYNKKIGPDPASINSCKIGGIAANNSSGMCCGVSNNSYHSLKDVTIVFADGTVLDTSCQKSRTQFISEQTDFIKRLLAIASRVKSNPATVEKIKYKYRLKNTTGYGVNALLDYDDPIDIIAHLMIGSEGTLGFIADITYKTMPVHEHTSTGLFLFEDIHSTCEVIQLLKQTNIEAVELLDYRALCSVADQPGMPSSFCDYGSNSAALLIQISSESADKHQTDTQKINEILAKFDVKQSVDFTHCKQTSEQLWAIRKAAFPAIGSRRELGTTVIIEDVAFPLESLSDGILGLQSLFKKYHYDEGIIFGHALDGNLHFVFTQRFSDQTQIQRYKEFMQEVAELVSVQLHGSLKAEHGTGRNMAPFVELEWGKEIYQVMLDIKQLFDPKHLLNPGVIINSNSNAHIENLKMLPAVDETIDKCIECGFCESACPSNNLTLSPRQRIAVSRRIQYLQQKTLSEHEQQELIELERDYPYYAIETCAATGMCAEKCPVSIDTGHFIKQARGKRLSSLSNYITKWGANHFSFVLAGARSLWAIQNKLQQWCSPKQVNNIGIRLRKLSSRLPLWHNKWPASAKTEWTVNTNFENDTPLKPVIVFVGCANRVMNGNAKINKISVQEQLVNVFFKAGFQAQFIEQQSGLCCGQPFESQGRFELAQQKQNDTQRFIEQYTSNGIPVVIDASACLLALTKDQAQALVFGLPEFVAKHILPQLTINKIDEPIALHTTCSNKRVHDDGYLQTIAEAMCVNLVQLDDIQCCGFAGNKGFFVPELNAHALRNLKKGVQHCTRGISNNRTCEIGLTLHSGIEYGSFISILDEVSVCKL